MENGSVAVPVIILIAALIIAAIAAVRSSKRRRLRRDALLAQAFGQPPDEDDDWDIGSIDSYDKYAAAAGDSQNRIDETTWNDLSMDDIFRRINVCSSDYGEEWLYHLLHELREERETARLEKLIAWMDANPEKRLALQKILRRIGKRKSNRLSYYVFHADAERIRHSWLFMILAVLPLAGVVLMPFFLVAGIVLAVAAAIANIVIYYGYRLNLEEGLESMRCFSAMLCGAKALGKKFGDLGYDFKRMLKPFRSLGGLVSGSTQQALAELEALTILFKAIFLIDLISYNRIIGKLTAHRAEFSELFSMIGELDAAFSILSFRKSLPHCCTPAFSEQNEIAFGGLYHPLIGEPVTNDGKIGNDCIITGSNASGKSTFIKALAVNNILAQTIHTCCAQHYRLKPCYVATSMALRDDISSGDSYFITEIKSLKRIIEYCSARCCTCFIDEILRGTNTPERIAASTAVLKELHQKGCLCVVASHDIELTQILGGLFDNYHFCETMDGKKITFDYLLKPGPSTTTNAVKLLEYMGFDPGIIREANRLLEKE